MIVRISAGYGVVSAIHKTPHTGIDFAVAAKTPLYAPYDGVVSSIRDYGNASLGKAVFVQKADGTQYTLGHLSDVANIKVGQVVEHGHTLLGYSGSTGRSTGPHLHYGEFSTTGQPIDPGYITFDSFEPSWMAKFADWFNTPINSPDESYQIAQNIADFIIMFLPEIATLGLLFIAFKIMLSPLWR